MRNFYIVANKEKDPDGINENIIAGILKELGAECRCQDFNVQEEAKEKGCRYTNPDYVPENTECVIILGGDGTLIQAAIDLNEKNLPLLGINIGTMGFLTDTDMSTARETLENVVNDRFEIDLRMMLDGSIYRNGEVIYKNIALNDIVINRCGILRVIDFDVSVNDEYLSSYSADGVIVATATGSTAYSLSAGGPILQPNAKLIMVTPICPHTLNKRSIIFGAEDTIIIEMKNNKTSTEERIASFDGERFFQVVTGDRIVIKKSDRVSRFVKTNKTSFLQRVREKMM